MKRIILDLGIGIILLSSSSIWGREPVPGSFAELVDLRSVCRQKAWRTWQASGYDRGDGFFDSGNFLRVEPERHYVMMETEGPGCIDRIWLTRKTDHEPYRLKIYVDDPEIPAIDLDMDAFTSGRHVPFVTPFTGEVDRARYGYVPIGFQEYCKVVAVPTAPEDQYNWRENSAGRRILHLYYQVTYRRFTEDTRVRRFQWELEDAERRAMAEAAAVWNKAGSWPWGQLSDLKEQTRRATIQPDESVPLFDVPGPGVIYGLEMRLTSPQQAFLEITWDHHTQPAVKVPVGSFFASPGQEEVHGLWLGCAEEQYYAYLPMPFHQHARLVLTSRENHEPIEVQARLRYRQEVPGKNDLLFHARAYDYNPPSPDEDYVVLSAQGTGHFVGVIMDRPGNMEGDDRFYVDGEKTPSIHGTGTEDFFNFAWGFDHLATLPLHGITRQMDKTLCYRIHLPAGVPFQERIRVQWEHGHGNTDQGHYSGIALYYLQSQTDEALPNDADASYHPGPQW